MANAYDYMTDDQEIEPEGEAMQDNAGSPFATLLRFMQADNIAAEIDEDELKGIAGKVVREYEIDKESRADWEGRTEEAMKLAMMVAKQKDYPFQGAANVKYPLLATAALQFNARAYPAIVPDDRVVKSKVNGDDQDTEKSQRGDRVSEYMSYQLTEELPEWEEDTDKLLTILPITGSAFRKVYYDPAVGRNTTRLVTADRLVVNYRIRSLESAPRITEEIHLYPHEIEERIRSKRFVEFAYGQAVPTEADNDDQTERVDAEDSYAPHLFLEQHRLIDLDGDGYPEPYVVTVHKSSEQVCRVVANYTEDTVMVGEDDKVMSIAKQDFYIHYPFMPNPEGGFYGMGFGWLLKDIQETLNTTLNQSIDAGHLANIQGGLVSSNLGIKEKSIRLKPGEWRVLNFSGKLGDSVLPINYPGPSQAMFALMEFLLAAGKEVASIKDVLTGEGQGKNASPTTTLALIEQGLQVFTAIYKRIYRSLKKEYKIHARLNEEWLDAEDYNAYFDGKTQYDPKADFYTEDMGITPVADPKSVSRMMKLAKADFIRAWAMESPLANRAEVDMRILEAAQIEDYEELISQPPPQDPEVAQLLKDQAYADLEGTQADNVKKITDAIKNLAQAEGEEEGMQMGRMGMILDTIREELRAEQAAEQMAAQQQQAAAKGNGNV